MVFDATGFDLHPLRVLATSFAFAPWVTTIFLYDMVNLAWEFLLLLFQTYFNVLLAQTTNEYWNQSKYPYLWKTVPMQGGQRRKFSNPFSHGVIQNILGFLTPYGKESSTDFTKVFAVQADKKSQ